MKNKTIALATMFLLIFILSKDSSAQSYTSHDNNTYLVNKIVKLLGSQTNIDILKGKKDIYTFNIKINLEKNGNTIKVADILSSDSIGYKVFPNYKQLRNIAYESFVDKNFKKNILLIPIIILNSPEYGQNPNAKNIILDSNTTINMISSLLYPDILQKNITIFPLFKIIRSDIE
ncbi:hypothetical protein GCM10022289_39700 [Pedobacter jeongneungensis]|uniref:Uncharacterized protein n=1 Tax=Pedobacter jeongneungensis TaxID=947309 RepID=A0ABP8BNP5_9SPHI